MCKGAVCVKWTIGAKEIEIVLNGQSTIAANCHMYGAQLRDAMNTDDSWLSLPIYLIVLKGYEKVL
jgi:hypothetical protein